ncbi:MAG: hypothetical protein L3J74_16190, partial [Bacteroidales bacterium]|nr:hypothetical protein [Bacteroidales bacterium]
MNKHNILLVLLSALFILLISANLPKSNTKNSEFNSYSAFSLPIDLKKKNYYNKIFTKEEQKELKKADKYLVSAKKYMQQYENYQKQIERQYTIAEATNSGKTMNKALKKAKKLEKKALKSGKKALTFYNKSNDIRSKIYSTAISRVRLNDNSKNAKIGREIELRAKSLFDEADAKVRTVPSHDEQLKFDALKAANDMRLKAFDLQEAAFGFYANDENLNPDDYLKDNKIENNNKDNTVITADTNFFPKAVEQYNPMSDPNLYRSKAGIILPKLNLTDIELSQIVQSNKMNQQANRIMKQVDAIYLEVDSLNMMAEKQTDIALKEKLKTKAIEREQVAFGKLLSATNSYIAANEIKYKVYKAHFPDVRPKIQTAPTERADLMAKTADDYYNKAMLVKRSAANLMYRSDRYLKLMSANDMLLYALQLQESAYGIYLSIPEAVSNNIDSTIATANVINNSKTSTKKENTSQKLSWQVLSTYTYSAKMPKPVKYKPKQGVVFHVQVGIFKGLLPPEKFAKVSPLIFDKFVKNPYRRFFAGEYRTYEAANEALKYVKAMGYRDAYLVSRVNGKRNSYAYGKSKLSFNENYKRQKIHELSVFTGEKVNISNNNNQTVNYGNNRNVKNVGGLAYYVQLGMFTKIPDKSYFNNISPIFTEKVSGKGTRYMTGPYQSISQARSAERVIKNQGFSDAYVSAYLNGNNIALTKAKNIEKSGKNTITQNYQNTNYSSANINFSVQIGAFRNKLSNSELQSLKKAYVPNTVHYKEVNGMNIYYVGNYKKYSQAKALQK